MTFILDHIRNGDFIPLNNHLTMKKTIQRAVIKLQDHQQMMFPYAHRINRDPTSSKQMLRYFTYEIKNLINSL